MGQPGCDFFSKRGFSTWTGVVCFTVGDIIWVCVGAKYLYTDSSFSEIILHHRIRRPPNPYCSQICLFDQRMRRGEEITDEETER